MSMRMIRSARRMNFKPTKKSILSHSLDMGEKGSVPLAVFATLMFMSYNGGSLTPSVPQVGARAVAPVVVVPFSQAAKGQVSSLVEKSKLVESVTDGENSILITLRSDDIFPVGTARIHTEAKSELQALAAQLLTVRNIKAVEIEGHTDSSPIIKNKNIFESNWELSSLRASHIIPFFQSAGFKSSFLSAVGYGDSRVDSALNRRIVLRVTGESE